jgi:RHS repeat-associated protein
VSWGANANGDDTHRFRVFFSRTSLREDAPSGCQPQVVENARLTFMRHEVLDGGMWKQNKLFSFGYQSQAGNCPAFGALKLTSLTAYGTDSSQAPLYAMAFGYGASELPIEYKTSSATCVSLDWPYLQTVSNGYGATTTFTYQTAWQAGPTGTDPNCTGSANVATWSRQRLATRTENPGIGASMTHTYSHTTGPMYFYPAGLNPIDAEYRGFRVVRDTDGLGDYSECTYYTTGWETETGMPGDTLTGHSFKCGWFESTGTEVKWVQPFWTSRNVATDVNFIYPWNEKTIFGPDYHQLDFSFDTYGNLSDTTETLPVYRRRSTGFAANTSAWIVGLPNSEIAYRNDPSPPYVVPVAKKTFIYDQNTSHTQAPTKGDMKREDHYDDSDVAHMRRGFGYDAYGNRTSETKYRDGSASLQKAMVFDSTYHAYLASESVTSVTPNHNTSYSYDFVLGKRTLMTDPNGQQWNTRYDTNGRTIQEWSPGDSETLPTTLYEYAWDSTAPNQTVMKRRQQAGVSDTLVSWEWKDGLERTIQSRAEGPSCASDVMVVDTVYDTAGQTASVSSPYASTNAGCVPGGHATNPSAAKTQYLYDAIGREVQVTNPHQTPASIRTTTYTGYLEAAIDENGHKTDRTKDKMGRLVTVTEYDGTNPSFTPYATTSFSYDLMDRQTGTTDHFGNQSTTTYNRLGFMTQTVDPDRGTWTYTYYDDGLLKTKDDARTPNAQRITYTYDSLDRIDGKTYSGYTTAPAVTYHYDQTPDTFANGGGMPDGSPLGRLTRVVDWAGEHLHSYDSRGRETDEKHVVASVAYSVGHLFDSMDREYCTVYPDGEKVGRIFDAQGVIEALRQYPNAGCAGTATAVYLDATNYNEAGMPTALTYGNALTATYGYRSSDWRLTNITVPTLLNYTYGYDAKSNINSIADSIEGTTQALIYDARDRLDYVTGLGQTIDYTYNAIGNITMKREGASHYTDMTYPGAGSPRPHAVSQAYYSGGSHSFDYDANGNMTLERDNGVDLHQYVYDTEGQLYVRVSTVDNPITAVYYHYDANGSLVRKVPSGQGDGTVYIGGIYEKDTYTGQIIKYYFAGGLRIAMRKAGALSFLTADHLGGTALVTDSAGGFTGRVRYYPYGKERTTQGSLPTDKLFTGQQRETPNGIYHYNARMYNTDVGRMVQADTVMPERSSPQAYNAYSYVQNNPANLIDPSGQVATPPGSIGTEGPKYFLFSRIHKSCDSTKAWCARILNELVLGVEKRLSAPPAVRVIGCYVRTWRHYLDPSGWPNPRLEYRKVFASSRLGGGEQPAAGNAVAHHYYPIPDCRSDWNAYNACASYGSIYETGYFPFRRDIKFVDRDCVYPNRF